MILLLYNLALLAGLVASVPWWLWRMATTHKYREGLGERLGKVNPWIASQAAQAPVIWVHAVSVGEVLAVSRLVNELAANLPSFQVLVSTTTRTGQELARERFGPNRVFYCPLDFPWAVTAHLDALKPRMLVLAETEFWPNILATCHRRGIPIVVVNGRISDRSWPRYQMLRELWKPFLSKISRALAQTETDAKRLVAIGMLPERVTVSGNLKFDVRAGQESDATRLIRSFAHGLRFVVAGSTLDGEEDVLLQAWPRLLQSHPDLAMILAPRHPERFAAVTALLERSGLSWVSRTSWKDRAPGTIPPIQPGQIILLDTIGELASIYSLATVAFVGGSLYPTGGHNPLEPAQFGVPIVMGPYYANFRDLTDDLREHDAVRVTTKEELGKVLQELLANSADATSIGARAREVFQAQAGATARSIAAIREVLSRGTAA